LGTGFIDDERAAHEFLAVERGDGFFGFTIVANLRKTETARLACKAVAKERQRIRLHTGFRKQRLNLLFCSLE